jgi:hypothetical protein
MLQAQDILLPQHCRKSQACNLRKPHEGLENPTVIQAIRRPNRDGTHLHWADAMARATKSPLYRPPPRS